MEGVFSFFLESTFLGLFLHGEKRLGPRGHWFAAFMVLLGSWLSGYFIIATDAWMQHPVGYTIGPKGEILLNSFWALLFNPWVGWQYLHNMIGAVITGCFVMAAVGAFYLLSGKHEDYGRTFVRVGVLVGVVATVLMMFPTGDGQGKNLARHQPVTLAAMEGLFRTAEGASMVLIGQPDMERMRLDNPVEIPRMLSFLTYNRWKAEVKGLDAFPRDQWPDNVPLLYFSYHIMVGLGDYLYRHHVAVVLALAEGAPLPVPAHAVGPDAVLSISVHCQHHRLDDRRVGPATVADLWLDANKRRHVQSCLSRQYSVHP
jgi:cytochrome d ubiquinol oxidase subunit I